MAALRLVSSNKIGERFEPRSHFKSRDIIGYKTRNQQLVRFDPSIVTVKQSSIVSQIVSSPVVLS